MTVLCCRGEIFLAPGAPIATQGVNDRPVSVPLSGPQKDLKTDRQPSSSRRQEQADSLLYSSRASIARQRGIHPQQISGGNKHMPAFLWQRD